MKNYLYLFLFLLFVSCSNETSDKSNGTLEKEDELSVYDELLALENQIFSIADNPKKIIELQELGKQLYSLSTKYILGANEHNLEHVYELAALGAEASSKYDDAINYLYQAQRNFPKSDKAAIYLFNRARILESKLNKIKEAKIAYQELIELYPNDSLAITMKLYLESELIDKSEDELLEFLDSASNQ